MRHVNNRLVLVLKNRFIFGYGFFLTLLLVMGDKLFGLFPRPIPAEMLFVSFTFPKFTQEPSYWIIVLVNNALFQRNDRVVGDMNILGTYFGAALRDVAQPDAQIILQQISPRQAVQGMHFQSGNPNEEAWPTELLFLFMISQHVADILAKETLDALAKLLHPIDVALIHLPFSIWARREWRNLFIDLVVPGNICNEVLNQWKGAHRLDGNWLIKRQSIKTRLAGQTWPAVDFRRARPALACFAVPAHR
jgi:hypothetical protein